MEGDSVTSNSRACLQKVLFAEDEALVRLMMDATQDRFVYYHHWRVGDVLMWDELATMHRGAGDYRPDERRVMLRTIVYAH